MGSFGSCSRSTLMSQLLQCDARESHSTCLRRLSDLGLFLVSDFRFPPVNLRRRLSRDEAVKFGSGPSCLVVASSSEKHFLELVHEEGVERSGKRDGLEISLCSEANLSALRYERRIQGQTHWCKCWKNET